MELPIKQGVISADDITGEIGDLIDGKVPGRTDVYKRQLLWRRKTAVWWS